MPHTATENPHLSAPQDDNVIDDVIRSSLPQWLTRSSSGQIARLREVLNAHHATQARLRGRTLGLHSPQVFAERQFSSLLVQPLPEGVGFEQLQWLQIGPSFSEQPGALLGGYAPAETRENGLLRLMHNFADVHFYQGTGLVVPGNTALLSGSSADLVNACRRLDVGTLYQAELARVYDATTQTLLASDKQSGLSLAVEVAALKGEINAHEQLALREMLDVGASHTQDGLKGYPGLLQILGCPAADGLLIYLRDKDGSLHSVMLYLPGDPRQTLRRCLSVSQLSSALVAALREDGYEQYFLKLIALDQRAEFASTLGKRLGDAKPDLELEGITQEGSIFDALARQQVQRLRDDARLLLIPTSSVDANAAKARRESWKAAGLSLSNLAGLFIPAVGAVLMAKIVVQTLDEVFEGVRDWSLGHQHEALEHMLGVAATVVATAATVATVSFMRSAFVDAMEIVSKDGKTSRLWASDLEPYSCERGNAVLQSDGRFTDGVRHWIRLGGRFTEVHQPEPGGLYRLRHPQRPADYGPIVLHNGERSWQLLHGRPQALSDSAAMLDTLWPHDPPLDDTTAERILRVAGMDQEELRGLLVENRRASVNLRVTLDYFDADARIEVFFRQLQQTPPVVSDPSLLAWCEQQFDVGNGAANVLRAKARLRSPLFNHLTQPAASGDGLARQLSTAFSGLPDAYAQALANDAHAVEEGIAGEDASTPEPQRIPLVLASKAHALARVARFNRMMAGCYLPSAYSEDTGVLLFHLLETLPLEGLNVSLGNDVAGDEPLASIVAGTPESPHYQLVHEQGGFSVYDEQGARIESEHLDGIYSALAWVLGERGLLGELQIESEHAPSRLRDKLMQQLPGTQAAIERLLGWAPVARWWNPGERLADGRVGYLLSGRRPARLSRKARLRDGLRQFFPGLDDAQLERELNGRWRRGLSVSAELRSLEDDLYQLTGKLNAWVGVAFNTAERNARLQVAEQLLRAWRGLGEFHESTVQGARGGLKLVFNGLPVTTLPDLPQQLTLQHVSTLVIQDTAIGQVHASFLQAFSELQRLDLSNNRLLACPGGLGYLSNLRHLRLARNQIRLNAQAVEALASLSQLTHLDLSGNPALGTFNINYLRLSQLTVIRLRRCGLKVWPTNIELCGFLREVDLRDNAIQTVPREVLRMPSDFRQAFVVTGNPLSRMELSNLVALDPIQEVGETETGRPWWVRAGESDAERGGIWDALSADADNAALFRLLERLEPQAGFSWQERYLIERSWDILALMPRDEVFASSVRSVLGSTLGDENDAIERFSQLLRLHAEARAMNNEPALSGQVLLSLGRSLYRLDRLQAFVLADIAERGAQLDAGLQGALGLRYRVRLRRALALPFQPLRIYDIQAPSISAALVASAQESVEAAAGDDFVAQYLCRQVFWQRFLERFDPAAFAVVGQEDALQALRQRLTLEYLQRMARIDHGTERGVGR
ncbi:NEL-type E3 ubiquitin ligase domain-containing protein [Pseudomonas sp. NPDC089547]|uniref:NEL-type E3 ubiquitin ligase domain-containing protein n=1 Tax=Pseudomonas sp. NPDC089547 TaxID=3390652 RepID=UPI003CFE1C66